MRISLRRSKPVDNTNDVNNAARELLVQARSSAKRVDVGREVTVVIGKQNTGVDRPSLIARIVSLASGYGLRYVRNSEGTFTFIKI